MSDVLTIEFESRNSQETDVFARQLGRQLRGGEIIELVGDVGAGKTTFVRGFVKGAGSDSHVSSPTFTVSNVYEALNVQIHHYDFYRLNDLAVMQAELQEVMADKHNVAVLEWAQAVHDVISNDHVTIQISVTGEDSRKFSCSIPQQFNYLKDIQ